MDSRAKILKAQLNDGSFVHIEVTEMGGPQDTSRAMLKFSELTASVERIVPEVLRLLAPLRKERPKKLKVELGLSVGLASGNLVAVLVKGQGTANLKVQLEWETEPA